MYDISNIDNNVRDLLDSGINHKTNLVLYLLHYITTLPKGNKNKIKMIKAYNHLSLDYKDKIKDLGDIKRVFINIDGSDKSLPLDKQEIDKAVSLGCLQLVGDTVHLNIKFTQSLFINKYVAFEEFLELFRGVSFTIKGKEIPILLIKNKQELKEAYYEAINNSLKNHNRVIKICTSAIENELVSMGIEKVINSKAWEDWDDVSHDDYISRAV